MLVAQQHIKIADILPTEYQDFLSYCEIAGKEFTDEISAVDYVAYRSQFGRDKKDVKELRNIIAESTVINNVENGACLVCDIDNASDIPASDVLKKEKNAEYIKSVSCDLPNVKNTTLRNAASVSFDKDSELTYAEALSLSADDYADVSIQKGLYDKYSITFSSRLLNALYRNKIKTVKDLLLLTPKCFRSLRNIGKTSADELERALTQISTGEVKATHGESNTISFSASDIRKDVVKEIAFDIIQNKEFSTSELTKSEVDYVEKLIQAKEELGADLCLEYMDREKQISFSIILNALQTFIDENKKCDYLVQAAHESTRIWDCNIQSMTLKPFIELFCATHIHSEEFKALTSTDILTDQYPKLVESQLNSHNKNFYSIFNDFEQFQEWMERINIDKLCESLFSLVTTGKQIIDEHRFDMLYARANGHTLEDIARENGITRERVRQIVSKATRIISGRIKDEYNLFAIASAYRNGDKILRKDELQTTFGEKYGKILWFIATQIKTRQKGNEKGFLKTVYCLDCDLCHYDCEHDAIFVTINRDGYKETKARVTKANLSVQNYISTLPSLIETSELQQRLKEYATEESLPLELLTLSSNQVYHQAGIYSYKGRLTVVQMCDCMLKVRFQYGYKISMDSERAVGYLQELFGHTGRTTPRAIDAKIMELGVLIDRGKYVHADCVDVDCETIEKVFSFIEHSPKSAFSYTELFEQFQDEFIGTIVSNRFALQGIMKFYNCPYESHKDYVSKEKGADVAGEFSNFMESVGTAAKEEILTEFPGWKDYNIAFVLPRCPKVLCLDNGIYMHAKKLNIQEEDRIKIKEYLDSHISDIPVSSRLLQDEFMNLYPKFMIRNDIQSHGKLFAVLQYMFPHEFHFSRPYIAKENVGLITGKSIVLQHIGDMDTIDIDDLIDIATRNGVYITGISAFVESLQPDLLRINATSLMRYECVGLSEDTYADILDTLREAIVANDGCLTAASVTDFTWYPSLNVPWTPFLLESVANLFPDEIHIIKMVASDVTIPHAIFVSDAYENEDYNSLVLRLVKEEHNKEPFTSKNEVLKWLQKKCICNTKYPAFLDNEHHLYYNEDGTLRVE